MANSFVPANDIFAWLALTDALSFEDFELGQAVSVFAGQWLSGTLGQLLPYSLILSGKRLFLQEGAEMNALLASGADILCMCCMSGYATASLSRIVRALRRLPKTLRCCALYRVDRSHLGCPPVTLGAEEGVEWGNGSRVDGPRSGLIFSSGWRPGIAGYVRDSLRLYDGTRPGRTSVGRLR